MEHLFGSYLPDGYYVDHEHGNILVFEIEDTSPLSVEKLEAYMNLHVRLDELDFGYSFMVVLADRYGNVRGTLPLYEYYLAEISRGFRDDGKANIVEESMEEVREDQSNGIPLSSRGKYILKPNSPLDKLGAGDIAILLKEIEDGNSF